MTASTSRKRATSTQGKEVLNDAVRRRTEEASSAKKSETAKEEAFADIQSNPFLAILFNPELSPEAKREEVAKTLTYAGTKEENRERVRQFEQFKEYLQHVRSEMAKEIIRLTDTKAFAELQKTYEELNGALLDFDKKMAPLTEIIDAVYTLRTNGETLNAFREIQEDREKEEAARKKREEISSQVFEAAQQTRRLQEQIEQESQNKSWFGLGGIKPEAQRRIETLKADLDATNGKVTELSTSLNQLDTEVASIRNKQGQYAAEKRKLRELLDISTDEHQGRQEALVNAAMHFVDTAKDRIGAVREHLGTMNQQVENLADANGQMTQVYAILNEGIKGARGANQVQRDALAPQENEDLIAKMTREEKQSNLDGHIKMLDNSAADTMMTYTDLTTQTIRIKAMKDSNEDQITRARSMHAQGVAGVADRLSVVLQAVSSAAINESSSMARDTLGAMADNTNTIAQKEVIRVAMGMDEQNQDLLRAIEGLASYGEVMRESTSIEREGIKEMREHLDRMQSSVAELHEDIRESVSVYATVGQPEGEKAPSKDKPTIGLPFKFGN